MEYPGVNPRDMTDLKPGVWHQGCRHFVYLELEVTSWNITESWGHKSNENSQKSPPAGQTSSVPFFNVLLHFLLPAWNDSSTGKYCALVKHRDAMYLLCTRPGDSDQNRSSANQWIYLCHNFHLCESIPEYWVQWARVGIFHFVQTRRSLSLIASDFPKFKFQRFCCLFF